MAKNNLKEYNEYENRIFDKYGSCSDCEEPKTFWGWCKNCNSKRFQDAFQLWTSGNEIIDNIIRDTQLKARNKKEVIEWIPYDRLRNIQYLARGGFSTVYKAIWLDGRIRSYWNSEKNQLIDRKVFKLNEEDFKIARDKDTKSPLQENEKTGFPIVLKSLNNSSDNSNISEDFLNEWKNYLKFIYSATDNNSDSVRLYGITQDPKTSDYMIVMEHMNYGSLRSNLMEKKYNPYDKFNNLYLIARSLLALHKCNLVHGDFHSGNLLLQSQKYAYISDFGLSRPADKPTEPDKIYGVLPYIAPEVLRGNPYTKASDIYSFGIIMWEMTSGVPAFNDVPHDFNLSLSICRGIRPEIIKDTEIEYEELMKRCWDTDPDKRPTAEELIGRFYHMRLKYLSNYDRKEVPGKTIDIFYLKMIRFNNKSNFNKKKIFFIENETIIQNHPLSCYTSRKFDYSAELNEILNKSLEYCRI